MRPALSPFRFLALMMVTAAAVLIGLVLLPDERYLRFKQVSSESIHYLRAKWIYERIHFDRTPIDVAFIGTSHTQSAVDSRIVEEALVEAGRKLHVVNFAIPHLGRDLHYLIVRELLENRRVGELVVELQEFEARAPHPAFQRLADVRDLATAPIVINTGFFENLVRLPLRQGELFLRSRRDERAAKFDGAGYEGAHWDDTYLLHGVSTPRTSTYTAAYLDERAQPLRRALVEKEVMARRFSVSDGGCSLLNRYNRIYLRDLLDLARRHGVQVTFLYLPFFHGPAQAAEAAYFRKFGATLTPSDALDDASSWLNVDHLNVFGARRASRWIGQRLATDHAPAIPETSNPHSPDCY